MVLNTAVERLSARAEDVGVVCTYEVGPAARDISDPTYVTINHSTTDRGRAPLAVTNIMGVLVGDTVQIT